MSDAALLDLLTKQITDFDLSEIETKRATHVAEELFLSHYEASGELADGVLTLLNHYADIYLKHDPARAEKLPIFEQLMREIQTPSDVVDYQNLLHLLKRGQQRYRSAASQLYEKADFDPGWHVLGDIPVHAEKITQFGHMLVLPSRADICVFGDSHGDLASVRYIVEAMIGFHKLTSASRPYLVFLGDYVNNGLKSVGLLTYVLQLQETYPDRVILLNGNHDNRETWLTVFKEFFFVHWNNYVANPYTQAPPRHYGHVRLDAARTFGVERGERLYGEFARWGHTLPYICFDQDKRVMMSHSLGKVAGQVLNLYDLAYGKQTEAAALARFGYEAWKILRPTPHSAMVTNRAMTTELMDAFHRLGIERFLIGHTHYLSGGDYDGRCNIASSHMDSPDAGHYMYREYVVVCREKGLPQGKACYVRWDANAASPVVRPVDMLV